jgi:hypothetical protein
MTTWNLPWAYQRRPSKPSPLDNPAFRRWFGNSMIRNADGTPRVVYHATPARGSFKPGRGPVRAYEMQSDTSAFLPAFTVFRTGWKDIGIHFGTREQANTITGGRIGSIVYPAYIRLENPLRMTDEGKWPPDAMVVRLAKNPERIPERRWTQSMEDLMRIHLSRDPKEVRLLDDEEVSQILTAGERETMGSSDGNAVMREMIVGALNRRGYDGIVYLNEYEDPKNPQDSYIVFDPRQIKAVYGNRGTYDPNDPDILNGF